TLWNKTTLKKDTVLGIVLSVFFGAGLVLMSLIQKKPLAHQALLQSFLLGKASLMLWDDVRGMLCVAGAVTPFLYGFWHILRMTSFDLEYAHVRGSYTTIVDMLLMSLLVLVMVAGVQVMGVILMSMLIIAPAAAARQWTSSLQKMMLLALLFGISSTVAGVIGSAFILPIPTGPAIVMIAGGIVCASLMKQKFALNVSKGK
ncbi:MAG TPA: metal ABC transporter permease, partial [Candidatus Bathyarchaeia archaeon]|nr:metal ABC transporter permease [Candidatus Bathyarchaeia archaeon]